SLMRCESPQTCCGDSVFQGQCGRRKKADCAESPAQFLHRQKRPVFHHINQYLLDDAIPFWGEGGSRSETDEGNARLALDNG
ncbi:hypothetical protein, partial [Brevundimonas naejangsanensis]|uniref:hypothetical protein n=1 Tax=Brevundimonas naejangsanensis TaxID=588932 RepID=UPI0034D6912C